MSLDRNLATFSAGFALGWIVHRVMEPQTLVVAPAPPPLPRPLPRLEEPSRDGMAGRPSFEAKLCDLQDELIKISIEPDRWDLFAWDKGVESEPVQLKNTGTKNHRVLSLYKRKADGTLDEEGMLVPIERLSRLSET